MLFELGYDTGLGAKLTSDTKDDLLKWKGLPKNQEYLLAQLELKVQKKHMSQKDWREANMFTPAGLLATTKRVKTDVVGQLGMRRTLIERGWLRKPRLWTP